MSEEIAETPVVVDETPVVVAEPIDEPQPVTPPPVKELPKTTSSTTMEPTVEQLAKKYLTALTESKVCPAALQTHIKSATPHLARAAQCVADLLPHLVALYEKALKLWEDLQPYKPHLLLPSLLGFVLCFFGGSFLTLISAVEAFRQVGYEHTLENAKILYQEFLQVYEANAADNKKDEDNDGVPDVLESDSHTALIQRKVMLLLRVVKPDVVKSAFAAVNAGLFAVIATLRLEFAKTLTLGNSIADVVEGSVDRHVLPRVEPLVPPEYRQWVKPTIASLVRFISVSLAWFLQRILSTVHSALRGGMMLSRNVLAYLNEMKIITLKEDDTNFDEIAGYGLALLGVLFQLTSGFSLPFPLNVLLFPFSIVEYILVWMVAK